MPASPGPSRVVLGIALLVAVLTICGCSPARVDSMLVIVVDTLRGDELGVMGYGRETTPEIDRWAQHARIYERAYSTAPWTLPAVGTLLTGTWPSTHHAGRARRGKGKERRFEGLSPELPTLAEIVSRNGWRTAAVVNNRFLDARFGLSRGFHDWDFHSSSIHQSRTADRTVDRAVEWLGENRGRRFFLMVHLFDPHLPYRAPPPYWDRWGGAAVAEVGDWRVQRLRKRLRDGGGVSIRDLRTAYDEEVRFTDAQIGRLLRALQELGLERRTAVLLTSDHGEEFQDHGGFEHGHTLYDELLRVPLILSVPGTPGQRIEAPVSLVDVAPTVLDLLGLPMPSEFVGVSLLHPRPAGERTFLAQDVLYGRPWEAVIRWPWKLLVLRQRTRLYRLDLDPGETRNLASEERAIVAGLRRELRRLGSAVSPVEPGSAVPLDPDTERELRSLGYVD